MREPFITLSAVDARLSVILNERSSYSLRMEMAREARQIIKGAFPPRSSVLGTPQAQEPTVAAVGQKMEAPPPPPRIVQIAAGAGGLYALDSEGRVWSRDAEHDSNGYWKAWRWSEQALPWSAP